MASKTVTKEHVHYSKGLSETRPIENHKSVHLLRGPSVPLATGVVANVTCPNCKRFIKQFAVS